MHRFAGERFEGEIATLHPTPFGNQDLLDPFRESRGRRPHSIAPRRNSIDHEGSVERDRHRPDRGNQVRRPLIPDRQQLQPATGEGLPTASVHQPAGQTSDGNVGGPRRSAGPFLWVPALRLGPPRRPLPTISEPGPEPGSLGSGQDPSPGNRLCRGLAGTDPVGLNPGDHGLAGRTIRVWKQHDPSIRDRRALPVGHPATNRLSRPQHDAYKRSPAIRRRRRKPDPGGRKPLGDGRQPVGDPDAQRRETKPAVGPAPHRRDAPGRGTRTLPHGFHPDPRPRHRVPVSRHHLPFRLCCRLQGENRGTSTLPSIRHHLSSHGRLFLHQALHALMVASSSPFSGDSEVRFQRDCSLTAAPLLFP